MNQLPLRPNVCMLVTNKENKLFLGERFSTPGIWQFPQGGVEPGLSLEENVYRELEEELGAARTLFSVVTRLETTHEYDFSVIPDYAVGVWRGQAQTFWLVRFSGDDSDIHLDSHKPEFMSFRWCTVSEVKAMAEPKRLKGYLPAMEEMERHLKKENPNNI